MSVNASKQPSWVKLILIGVFLYYFLSGVFLVFSPQVPFDLLKLERSNHPWLVQMCGILTAVFGLVFLVAARDPRASRSFILIGLLAQILVPLAVTFWIRQGVLPLGPIFGLVFSDLLIAVLLALILARKP